MRELWPENASTVVAFAVMATVALVLAAVLPAPSVSGSASVSPLPKAAIPLPPPALDADRDSYADTSDLWDGDLLAEVELTSLDLGTSRGEPYVLVGTQDDHARHGAGAELEWPHIVDPDPLGHDPGSPRWQDRAIRTGAWVASRAGEDSGRAIAESPTLPAAGAPWPQRLVLNVRDDRASVALDVSLWDASRDPHRQAGQWTLRLDVANGTAEDRPFDLATASGARLAGTLRAATGLAREVQDEVAQRWSPVVRFDSAEQFYPVPGEALERFHGFAAQEPLLATWELDFNNGRDSYRLLLADFTGDRGVDHRDAKVMADVLASGPLGRPTLYANVLRAHDGAVVVQYWFLYMYNFVPDREGRDIGLLGHSGDRELMQLTFSDETAARTGQPTSVSYGQHYGGIRLEPVPAGLFEDGHPKVYVSRGSHALYPVPGDDRALRPAFTEAYDRFDGGGTAWLPGGYAVEVLDGQPWHMGHRWGPLTRYSRDLGISLRPLLQHDFRYPATDPLDWESALTHVEPDGLPRLYGGEVGE